MGNDPPNSGQFKQGWAGGPGRPRGSKTRVKADLAQLILDGAAGGGVCVRRRSQGRARDGLVRGVQRHSAGRWLRA
jgi:hypothetical protein